MSVRVPATGYLRAPTRELVLTVVRRPRGEPTACAKDGTAFSLAGVIGVSPPPARGGAPPGAHGRG